MKSHAICAIMLVSVMVTSCHRGYIKSDTSDGQTISYVRGEPIDLHDPIYSYVVPFEPRQVPSIGQRADSLVNIGANESVDMSISSHWAILMPVKDKDAPKDNTKQKKGSKKSEKSTPKAEPQMVDKYPRFNSGKAMTLWKMMRRSDQFSQDDYSSAIDLCIISYDYLINEYQKILGYGYPEKKRRDCLTELDNGKGSEMMNFCNTFSRRLVTFSSNGELNDTNLGKLNEMLDKKQKSRDLLDRVTAP